MACLEYNVVLHYTTSVLTKKGRNCHVTGREDGERCKQATVEWCSGRTNGGQGRTRDYCYYTGVHRLLHATTRAK